MHSVESCFVLIGLRACSVSQRVWIDGGFFANQGVKPKEYWLYFEAEQRGVAENPLSRQARGAAEQALRACSHTLLYKKHGLISSTHFPHGISWSICSKNSFFFVWACDSSSISPDRLICLFISFILSYSPSFCSLYFVRDCLRNIPLIMGTINTPVS